MVSFNDWYCALAGSGSAYERVLSAAFGPGQAVGQQGLSTAEDILALARAAGAGPGKLLLDLCSGPGGPAALIARRLDCRVVALDRSLSGLRLARHHSPVLPVTADALQLPFREASFNSVLLIDSLVSLLHPTRLLREIARVLLPGGRLGCTAQVGQPLSPTDQARLAPDAEAHLVPADQLLELLCAAGLQPLRVDDHTAAKLAVSQRLGQALVEARGALARELGATTVAHLTATITTWTDLMARGKIADLTIVAECRKAHGRDGAHSRSALSEPEAGVDVARIALLR